MNHLLKFITSPTAQEQSVQQLPLIKIKHAWPRSSRLGSDKTPRHITITWRSKRRLDSTISSGLLLRHPRLNKSCGVPRLESQSGAVFHDGSVLRLRSCVPLMWCNQQELLVLFKPAGNKKKKQLGAHYVYSLFFIPKCLAMIILTFGGLCQTVPLTCRYYAWKKREIFWDIGKYNPEFIADGNMNTQKLQKVVKQSATFWGRPSKRRGRKKSIKSWEWRHTQASETGNNGQKNLPTPPSWLIECGNGAIVDSVWYQARSGTNLRQIWKPLFTCFTQFQGQTEGSQHREWRTPVSMCDSLGCQVPRHTSRNDKYISVPRRAGQHANFSISFTQ